MTKEMIDKELLVNIKRELEVLKKWAIDRRLSFFINDDVNLKDESEFKDIYVDSIDSKNATRSVILKKDGDVFFSKNPKRKNKKQISYDISYNLLNNDFNVEIKKPKHGYHTNNIMVNLQDNIVIKTYNNFEIIEIINMEMKKVKIKNLYDNNHNYSLTYEMILNNDNSLEEAKIEMKTYKANGKVNGTYRLTADKEDGIDIVFFSRKGIKRSILSSRISLNVIPSDDIVYSLLDIFSQIVSKENHKISIDKSDFCLEKIKEIDTYIINELKGIKGELILPSLSVRINKYLKQVDRHRKKLEKSILKLKLNKY